MTSSPCSKRIYDVHKIGLEALHVVVRHDGQLALGLHLRDHARRRLQLAQRPRQALLQLDLRLSPTDTRLTATVQGCQPCCYGGASNIPEWRRIVDARDYGKWRKMPTKQLAG